MYLKFGDELENGWWEALLCEVDFYDAIAGEMIYDQEFGISYSDAPERVTIAYNNNNWWSGFVCPETEFFLWVKDTSDLSRVILKQMQSFKEAQDEIVKNREDGQILAKIFQIEGIISRVSEIYIDLYN
ncbi:MAG: hypothetical protein LBC84_10470 [Prevotellaceae bacterium]|nr:hypothetical protein [Prevotellaceae bacterium]